MNKYKIIAILLGSMLVNIGYANQKNKSMEVSFVVQELCTIAQNNKNNVNVNCVHMTPYQVTQTVMNNPHIEEVHYDSNTQYTLVTITF